MVHSGLNPVKSALNSVGWFIPPCLSIGFLRMLQEAIDGGQLANHKGLEAALTTAYSPGHLAAMVCERYPITPYVRDYAAIISEAVEAHCLGLGHVAVTGLLPVIEGAGRKLAHSRSVPVTSIKSVFANLATDCKTDAIEKNIGAVDEIISMMDSFIEFTGNYLYVTSDAYPLSDNTNRHGTLHGAYSDEDYGDPVNFYKAIASVDFLCMVSAFRANVSWMAPDQTPASIRLSAHYHACAALSRTRPLWLL